MARPAFISDNLSEPRGSTPHHHPRGIIRLYAELSSRGRGYTIRMPSLVTVDQIREHIETDVTDAGVQRYIDEADFEIVTRYGAHTGTVIEYFTPGAGDAMIFTTRPVGAVSMIVETTRGVTGDEELTISANDYIVDGRRQIRRIGGGDNPGTYWAPRVKVVYTPVADTAKRVGVLIDLVRLACRYDAASSTKLGDVSINHVDYALERERLLYRLQPTPLGMWA